MKKATNSKNRGRIIRIAGPVVDVAFERSTPQVNEALNVSLGKGKRLVLEVAFQTGNNEVRTLALGPTD